MAPQRAVPPAEVSKLKNALNELVEELRHKKLIKNASDLAASLGLQRNTLSGYMAINGPTPSGPFIEAVRKKFGIDLRTFKVGKARVKNVELPTLANDMSKEIRVLQSVVYILKLKMVDVLSDMTKKPASEITQALEKEIAEHLIALARQ